MILHTCSLSGCSCRRMRRSREDLRSHDQETQRESKRLPTVILSVVGAVLAEVVLSVEVIDSLDRSDICGLQKKENCAIVVK